MRKFKNKAMALLFGNNSGGAGSGGLLSSSPFLAQLIKSLVLQRGTGSPTFTRATTKSGQKYDPAGNLLFTALSGEAVFSGARRVRNYAPSSEDFSSGSWAKSGVTASASQLTEDGTTGVHRVSCSLGAGVTFQIGTVCVAQIEVKQEGRGYVQLTFGNPPFGATSNAYYNLQNGSVVSTGAGATATITPSSGGYYLLTLKSNAASSTSATNFFVNPSTDGNTVNYTGTNGLVSVSLRKVQVEDVTGHSASHQVAGEYVSVGVLSAPFHGSGVDGVKCFDTDIDGNPLSSTQLQGYSAEPAATNLCLQSQTFQTTWVPGNATVSIDSTAAPDGTTTADSLVEDATAAVAHSVTQAITKAASSGAYTFSVSAKKSGRDWIALTLYDNTALGARAWFNVNTGVVGSTANIGAGMGAITTSITAQANGFYRCTMSVAASGTATRIDPFIYSTNADTVLNVNGLNAVGLYLWGAQLETGSTATSYIATTTIAVARNADVLTFPSAGNISGTVGACYAEHSAAGTLANARIIGCGDLTSANTPLFASSNLITGIYDGTSSVNTAAGSTDVGVSTKSVSSYSGSTKTICRSGGTVASGAFDGDVSLTGGIGIGIGGSTPYNGHIKNVRIFTRALSDSEMRAITS